MKLVGFDNVSFKVLIEKSLNEEIQNQINEDLNREVFIPVSTNPQPAQSNEEPKRKFHHQL